MLRLGRSSKLRSSRPRTEPGAVKPHWVELHVSLALIGTVVEPTSAVALSWVVGVKSQEPAAIRLPIVAWPAGSRAEINVPTPRS